MQGVHVGDAEEAGRGQHGTGQDTVGGQHVRAPALDPVRCTRLIRLVHTDAGRAEHLTQVPAGLPVPGRVLPYVQDRRAQPELREAAGQDRRHLLQSACIQHAGDDQAPRPGQITIATRGGANRGRRPARLQIGGPDRMRISGPDRIRIGGPDRLWIGGQERAVESRPRRGHAGSGAGQGRVPGVGLGRRAPPVVPGGQPVQATAQQARNEAAGAPGESHPAGRGQRDGLGERRP